MLVLRKIKKAYRNFIWSDNNINNKKLIMMVWKKMFQALAHCGLDIRSLIKYNEATNLKLGWDLLNSEDLGFIAEEKSFTTLWDES